MNSPGNIPSRHDPHTKPNHTPTPPPRGLVDSLFSLFPQLHRDPNDIFPKGTRPHPSHHDRHHRHHHRSRSVPPNRPNGTLRPRGDHPIRSPHHIAHHGGHDFPSNLPPPIPLPGLIGNLLPLPPCSPNNIAFMHAKGSNSLLNSQMKSNGLVSANAVVNNNTVVVASPVK